MRVQFDRVLRYPKEVHDEDDKLAAAFFARAVYACLMSRREFEKSRFPPRLRQVTRFHSWIPQPE